MRNTLGAHEVLEIHEVLNDAVNGINQFHLYEPHVQGDDLRNILSHQLNFMQLEYNMLIDLVGSPGRLTEYSHRDRSEPIYGLDQPPQYYPKAALMQLKDQDIAAGMLNCHKSSAIRKMTSALECAAPQMREALIQGAKNCADQAYELFLFMNKRGYYQMPYLSNQDAILGQYEPAPTNVSPIY